MSNEILLRKCEFGDCENVYTHRETEEVEIDGDTYEFVTQDVKRVYEDDDAVHTDYHTKVCPACMAMLFSKAAKNSVRVESYHRTLAAMIRDENIYQYGDGEDAPCDNEE